VSYEEGIPEAAKMKPSGGFRPPWRLFISVLEKSKTSLIVRREATILLEKEIKLGLLC
jgi:hypothetical protein